MKENRYNILVTIDDNYLEPCKVMLYSLIKNNKSREITVFLIYQNLNKQSLHNLKFMLEKMGAVLKPIYVDKKWFYDAPKREHITNATYLRLLAPQLLPETVDRVLYLDADIIVDGSIDQFYDMEMGQNYFAAVKDHLDFSDGNAHKKTIGMPVRYTYVCAGILLMNIKLLRTGMNIQDVYNLIIKKGNTLYMQDQDIINALYYNKIKVVSSIWGKEAWLINIKNKWLMLLQEITKTEPSPVIIHYLYKYKPWNKGYIGRYMKNYWKYARVFKKHKNYNTIKENYKRRIVSEINGYLGLSEFVQSIKENQ